MKQKLLNKFWLRVGIIVAIMTTALSGTAWAETVTLVSGSGTSNYAVPTGWTTSGTVGDGSYLKFDDGTITSPEFAPHTGLSFTYTVATYGGGTNHPLTIRVLNASTNAVIVEKTTATPTSTSYTSTNSPLSLGDVNVAFKIQLYAPTGKGVRLRNYSITGTPVGGSSAVATETTIDASGITNTDVYTGTAAGSLSASVTAGGNAVAGATVTWSGNNDDVATINASTGAVTLVGAGSVIFTASYEGVANTYQASSDTYEMTVTDSTPIPTFTVTLGDDSSTLTEVSGGAGVTLPSRDNVGRYTFAGWSETNVTAETTTAPIIIPAGAYNPTENVTLYPVYTKAEGSAAPSPFEVGNTGDFVIVFDRIDGSGKYFALPTSPTVSGGKITPGYVTVSDAEGVKYVTPENAKGFTWTIAAATNGYTLSDGDNYIYHSNGGSSGTDLAYGSSTSYTWSFTKDGNYVKMAGMSGSTVNTRGMLLSESTIGGYALSNWGKSGYYKTMILPVCSNSTTYYYSTPVAKTEPQILCAEEVYHNQDLSADGACNFNLSGVSPNYGGLVLHSEIVTASTTIDPGNYTWENQVLNVSGLAKGQGGTVVIRFWVEENEEYYGVEKIVTVHFRPQPVIPYDGEIINTYLGTSVTVDGSRIQGGAITLESSDTDVATVNGSTITPVAVGTTTITINTAAVDDAWQAGTATFTLNVTAPPTWTLASSITSGKHYIIVNKESSKAMGAQNSNNRAAVGVYIDDETVTVTSADVQEFVIYGPDADGLYTICDGTGYLYAASSGSNYLKTQATVDDNARWEISIDEGVASIKATQSSNRNVMQYNSGSTLFSCYGSASQSPVYLYEKDGEATPTESVTVTDAGYATYCSENALDFTDTDIKAYVGTKSGDKLTFTPATQVPAGTGLLLVYAGGKTENVPVIASATAVEGNCLVGVNAETTISSNDYILNVVNGGAGFYKAGSFTSLGAHKAYIPAAAVGNGVKGFTIDFDDDATGISLMEDGRSQMEDGVIYNLAGQRISKMQKGINIVNGKKILK